MGSARTDAARDARTRARNCMFQVGRTALRKLQVCVAFVELLNSSGRGWPAEPA